MNLKTHILCYTGNRISTLHFRSIFSVFLFGFLGISGFSSAFASPNPGDIYREYKWAAGPDRHKLIFADKSICTHTYCPETTPPIRSFNEVDLVDAVSAEVMVEYWSGHIGTSGKAIIFNGHTPIMVATPQGTPSRAECYLAVSNEATATVPLDFLLNGTNSFTWTTDRQVCHGFDYPAWSVLSVVLRVYYNKNKIHATGRIVEPQSGDTMSLSPRIMAEHSGQVESIDFVGEYEDFDFEGNGLYRQWHYRYEFGELLGLLGSSKAGEAVNWDTTWVPKQDKPVRLSARIRDKNGVVYQTAAVDNLNFISPYDVRMIRATDVDENFVSWAGKNNTCNLVIDSAIDISAVKKARLVVKAGAPQEGPGEFGINGTILKTLPAGKHGGPTHSIHEVEVPVEALKTGANNFYILSHSRGHALEVMWPGPALYLMLADKTRIDRLKPPSGLKLRIKRQ